MARPNRETARHSSAWEYWFALGADRSISEVAKRFKVSVHAVNNWRLAFSWDRRLADRERTVAGLVAEKCAEDEAESRANYLKLCRATMIRYAEAIKAGTMPVTPGDFVRVAQLEQLLRGKATDRSEVIAGPAFAALIERLIAVVDREVADPELRARLALGFQAAAGAVGDPPAANA